LQQNFGKFEVKDGKRFNHESTRNGTKKNSLFVPFRVGRVVKFFVGMIIIGLRQTDVFQ